MPFVASIETSLKTEIVTYEICKLSNDLIFFLDTYICIRMLSKILANGETIIIVTYLGLIRIKANLLFIVDTRSRHTVQKLNFTCSYGGGGDGPGRQLAAAEDDAGR